MSLMVAKNHPETMPFVQATGKLIQNFGSIELQTYEWIEALQTDPIVLEIARKIKLRDRVKYLKQMIHRSQQLPDEFKGEMNELWSSILPHSEVRNIVAHNAVALGFPDGDSTKPATITGVLNFKPRDKSKDTELVSIEEINRSVNATSEIGEALVENLEKLKGYISESSS